MSEAINKKFHVINMAIFCSILLMGGILSLAMKKEEVSEMENRKLAIFPTFSDSTLWSGKYFKAIEVWYADHFPWRDKLVDISAKVRNKFGVESGEIKIYDQQNLIDLSEDTTLKKNKPTDGPLPDDGEVGEVKKRLFVFKNRAFEMFGGGPAMGKSYASVINSYNQLAIPNLQVWNLIIPVALEFEITEKYKSLQKPNRSAIENIYNTLDSNIKKVWAIDEMRNHRSEYIYFNTDHHWTSLGAYYAYVAFCKEAAMMPVSLTSLPSKVKPSFLGSLYRTTRDAKLKENPDSVRYYIFADTAINFFIGSSKNINYWSKSKMYAEGASGSNSYSVFIQGDLPIVKMETAQKNGRKILMVKESYGNAFAPFLVNNFEKVVVIDQRHYTGNIVEVIKKEGITDLLFINNIFAAHTPFHIDKIKRLKK